MSPQEYGLRRLAFLVKSEWQREQMAPFVVALLNCHPWKRPWTVDQLMGRAGKLVTSEATSKAEMVAMLDKVFKRRREEKEKTSSLNR